MDPSRNKQYHLIGIGGIGMSSVAQLLLRCGKKVSGSDLKENKITQELKNLGAEIVIGHNAANVKRAGLIVYSTAIKENNPEIIEAKRLGIPMIKRAEALANLMLNKTVITVTGSHGKTTTTSLVSCLLLEANLYPTVAIGGILKNIDTNACLGNGRFFVAEADESDGSFLYYRPKYSIITNIDREHLDYYKTLENEISAFKEFLKHTEEGGCLFCCADDENLMKILKGYKNKYILFGLKDNADIIAKNIQLKGLSSEFDCFYKHKFIHRFKLSLGGRHNISNALAVIALGLELGIDFKIINNALARFRGAHRRLEIKFKSNGITVIDDYAHHPTEIRATLEAAKELNPKRLIAIFQPHRFSRTKLLLGEFGASFCASDIVIITDIYPASEVPIEGITGRKVYDKIKELSPGKEAKFLPKAEIIESLLKILKPGDLVITLGAGDIARLSDELAEKLKRRS